MTKTLDGHVRICNAEKAMMDKKGWGFSRVFRVGLDTLRLWIQSDAPYSCVYLYNTGKKPAAECGASLPSSEPLAHACCCPACPIRSAFGNGAALKKSGQKENHIVQHLDRVE
jgi:hypothetical protein